MLTKILIAIPAFLLAITLLVAIHEFGHYWVAKKLGVKVLRFSIGFGKPFWSKTPQNNETEFVLSVLPLGGYVKMLDERFDEDIAPEDISRAYNQQSPWKRILILLAGPAANFIFAIAAFYVLFMIGVHDYKNTISPTHAESVAAKAGLQIGDEVLMVNGQGVRAFENLVLELVDGVISGSEINLTVKRGSEKVDLFVPVNPELSSLEEPSQLLLGLGIKTWLPQYHPVIAGVLENSPSKEAGLQAGDSIVKIDGVEVDSVEIFITQIKNKPKQTVNLHIFRPSDQQAHIFAVNVAEKTINDNKIGIIGASLSMPEAVFEQMRTRVRFGPIESLKQAVKSTYDMSALSLKMFKQMIMGNVSLKNLSGPISIAEQASYSAQSGFDQFVKFLALISIALGIVNLLPVPMLDGGQIVFNVIELVKGSPVSLRTEMVFQQLGVMSIFLIMGLAVYNDLERLLF